MDYKGFWMNCKSGKTLVTSDHVSTILAKSEIFGISKNDISAMLKNKVYTPSNGKNNIRHSLLKKAFDNDWVRIRIANQSWTCEFSGNMSNVVDKLIKKFGDDMGPFTIVNLHDIRHKDNRSLTYTELLDAHNSGMFDDEQTNIRDKIRQRLFPAGSEERPNFSLESLKRIFVETLFKFV